MTYVCDGKEKGSCEEGGQTNSINMQLRFSLVCTPSISHL